MSLLDFFIPKCEICHCPARKGYTLCLDCLETMIRLIALPREQPKAMAASGD